MSKRATDADSAAAAANPLGDSLEMMRKFWGAAGVPPMTPPLGLGPIGGLTQGLPSMMTPTLDLAEIDKRIADLRAVEQWLSLNLNMLRTTTQSLEVQRNTIATLQSLGGAFSGAFNAAADSKAVAAQADAPPAEAPPAKTAKPRPRRTQDRQPEPKPDSPAVAPPSDPMLWWNALQQQFNQIASVAAAPAGAPPKKPRGRDPG